MQANRLVYANTIEISLTLLINWWDERPKGSRQALDDKQACPALRIPTHLTREDAHRPVETNPEIYTVTDKDAFGDDEIGFYEP